MAATKRVKISFSTVNEGNFTVIDKEVIAKTNERVKKEMKTVVRDFEKKETQSLQQAATLVLNA